MMFTCSVPMVVSEYVYRFGSGHVGRSESHLPWNTCGVVLGDLIRQGCSQSRRGLDEGRSRRFGCLVVFGGVPREEHSTLVRVKLRVWNARGWARGYQ